MAKPIKRGKKWLARVQRRALGVDVAKTFSTKAAAERWMRQVEVQIENGEFIDRRPADRITVSEALDRYLSTVAKKKKGRGYECNVSQSKRLKELLGNIPLGRVTSVDVASYRDKRLEQVSETTVRLELALLSHLYTVAETDWGLPVDNPVAKVKKPSSKGRARDRRLRPGEEETLLNACKEYGGSIHDVVVFAIETAMRRGEIASLRWCDVDLNNGTAKLHYTKNSNSYLVPLSPVAIDILKRRSKVRRLDDDRVFNLDAYSITKAFRRVCRRAGIEDLRFHDLRHEATSRLFESGLSVVEVAAITHHESLAMLKRYTHLHIHNLVEKLKRKGS